MYANIYLIYAKIFKEIINESDLYMKLKLFSLILTIFTLLSLFTLTAGADEADSRIKKSTESFLDPAGEILGVSSKGEWGEYPENSIPAIIEAAKTDIDFVAVDVKRAYCGSLILFSDSTTERMLDSQDILTVADTDYSVLSAYKLKKGCGGSNEEISEESIPLLSEAIKTAKENDIPLILRCAVSDIGEVSLLLEKEDALSMCIILTDGKISEIEEILKDIDNKPYIIGSKKGNVIFNMLSFINGLEEISAKGVQLQTVNRYGINFYYSVLGMYTENMRAILDHTTPEISGFREDSESYWNDVISRGYSVIITDHAERFSEYKDDVNTARERLKSLYDKYVTNHTLPDFRDEVLSDLKKAYTDAVALSEKLLADNSSSLKDLTDCYSKLFKAANDVNKNFSSLEDGSAGTTITAPRIILCIAAVIAVVTVQIYFFKRRKKVG